MNELYTGTDLLVQTSVREGAFMCLLEARAYALSVVISAVGGSADVITGSQGGFRYPANDVEALVGRVDHCLVDAELRLTHGLAIFENTRRRFALRTWVGEHVCFYNRVLCA